MNPEVKRPLSDQSSEPPRSKKLDRFPEPVRHQPALAASRAGSGGLGSRGKLPQGKTWLRYHKVRAGCQRGGRPTTTRHDRGPQFTSERSSKLPRARRRGECGTPCGRLGYRPWTLRLVRELSAVYREGGLASSAPHRRLDERLIAWTFLSMGTEQCFTGGSASSA